MAAVSMRRTRSRVCPAVEPWGISTAMVTQSESISGMKTNLMWPPAMYPAVASNRERPVAMVTKGLTRARRTAGV